MKLPETKWQIDTPALTVDLPTLKRNILKMADFFKDKTARVRPHFKTPKTVEIARMQLEAGAAGITCAKVSEAEVLVEAGIRDILIANEVVGGQKINRLVRLLKKGAEVKLAVDGAENIRELSALTARAKVRLGVLIDINVGLPRCGVAPEQAVELARLVMKSPGLELRGIMGYEGHIVLHEDAQFREQEAKKSMARLLSAKELIEQQGMKVEIVSGGGTGTYNITGVYPGVTEVQAGSYALMDTRYDKLNLGFEKAVTALATVISTACPGFIITDAGEKFMSIEFGMPRLIGVPDAQLAFLSEEHGHITYQGGQPPRKVGDKVEFYPSHICTTLNLNDWLWVVEGEKVVDCWKIAARGKSQ
jgi:D-serine deaminase-like pyridoxal phosphate-dependent protein